MFGAAGQPAPALVDAVLAERAANGAFEDRVNTTAFAILALKAASDVNVSGSVRWLRTQQNADGGFNFAATGGASGIDDTSAPLQALVAAGQRRSKTVKRAVSFLTRQQNPDGGFPLSPGGASNAQSTAWAIQGLVAAGRNPTKVRRDGSRNPLAYLRSLTGPDGDVRYDRSSAQTPVWVTAQALAALAREPFPLRAVRRQRATPVATAAPTATATAKPKVKPQPTSAPRLERDIDLGPIARRAGMLAAVFL